jgi:hypothetical protein
MCKNYFSQLLNVHSVSDVRQIEVHMTEPLVPGPSGLEVEIVIAKLKKYKSPGSDQNSCRTDSGRRKNVTVCHPQTHYVYLEYGQIA